MVQVSRVVDSSEDFSLRRTTWAPLHEYAALLRSFDPCEGCGEPLRGFHASEVVDVALRGRVTVDVQTFHAPPGLDYISAFCRSPQSSSTMLLCQHLGWDPWGKKVCRGRRSSARAERVEAQRPHRDHGRDHRPDLRLRPGLYRERPSSSSSPSTSPLP